MYNECDVKDCFIKEQYDGCSFCYMTKKERVKADLEKLADMIVTDNDTDEDFKILADSIMHTLEECEKEKALLLERLQHSETERFQPERVRVKYDFIGDNKLWAGYIK